MYKYLFVCLLVLCTLVMASVSCTPFNTTKSSNPIHITDQLGRVVAVDEIPQRIVSLAPSNTEILYALGLENRVVGVTSYDDYPPEVKEKPDIGGFFSPNLEAIISLEPNLVLATSVHKAEVIPFIEKFGLPVVALDPNSLDEVMDAISTVGKITGQEKEASELINQMQNRIDFVTSKTESLTDSQRPKVFYITWHDPIQTAGAGNIGDDLIAKAGGTNIFLDLEGAVFVTLEEIINANPEVIIAGIGMGTGEDLTYRFAMNESRLENIDARLNNRIYSIDIDLSGRSGPRIVEGLERFAQFMHPDLFPSN